MELELLKEKRKDIKGKEIMAPNDYGHDDTQNINSKTKTRGLKRDLGQEKHGAGKLCFEERIAKEI